MIRRCSPRDRSIGRREGLVLGEGAAIFVLEELDHALDRRANIYAEIAGFGSGSEGTNSNKLGVRCDALSHAITEAIVTAGITAGQIDYFNAHGNAMKDYDRIDTEAFRSVLGAKAYGVPISSIKSMIGHAMGAAGALQVAATCLTIVHSVIPPTINYEFRDPECEILTMCQMKHALATSSYCSYQCSRDRWHLLVALVLKSPTPSD